MAATQTKSEPSEAEKENTVAIAIILPALFAVVLIMLLAIAFLLPKITGADSAAMKEERRKKRMAKLDEVVKTQRFVDWAAKRRDENPDTISTMNPTCVICLDEIEDAAPIRALGCLHVFHQACLDDWFARWNEYCPLCHRRIIPGMGEFKRRMPERPPVAFLA